MTPTQSISQQLEALVTGPQYDGRMNDIRTLVARIVELGLEPQPEIQPQPERVPWWKRWLT